jgi:hypothetical protein
MSVVALTGFRRNRYEAAPILHFRWQDRLPSAVVNKLRAVMQYLKTFVPCKTGEASSSSAV